MYEVLRSLSGWGDQADYESREVSHPDWSCRVGAGSLHREHRWQELWQLRAALPDEVYPDGTHESG